LGVSDQIVAGNRIVIHLAQDNPQLRPLNCKRREEFLGLGAVRAPVTHKYFKRNLSDTHRV